MSPKLRSQRIALDTGELAARHARVFAGGLTFTDPAHQASFRSCAASVTAGANLEVELRPLSRYDALIPA